MTDSGSSYPSSWRTHRLTRPSPSTARLSGASRLQTVPNDPNDARSASTAAPLSDTTPSERADDSITGRGRAAMAAVRLAQFPPVEE